MANDNNGGSDGSSIGYSGTPTASVSGGSISTPGDPGYTPDYQSLIYGDPGYLALKAAMDSSLAAFNAQMRGQIQQDVLNSGYVVPGAVGFLSKAQQQEALNNPYSQAALAAKGHQFNIRNIQNMLAARGGYSSGELPYGLGNEGDRFNMQTQQQESALANEIRQLIGQQAQLRSQWMAQLGGGLEKAANTQLALHPMVSPTPGTSYSYDPSSGQWVTK